MGVVKNLTLTLLGFCLAVLVRAAIVPPVPGPVETDINALLAQRGDCTVLFFGPSYTNQVEPEIFDREARSLGYDVKACRFGIGGLRSWELRRWLEHVLSHDWPKLEFVMIDVTLGDELNFDEENWLKARTIEWHTWQALPWLSDRYAGKGRRKKKSLRLGLWARHLEHVAAHYLAVGQGTRALGKLRLLETRAEPAENEREVRRLSPGGKKKRKARYRGKQYERVVERLVSHKQKPKAGKSAWPLELRRVTRAYGKEAYFVIAPVLYKRRVPKAARRGSDRLVVLDFNDPRRFPELYTQGVRGNTSHLNRFGNVIYSKLLAHELHGVLKKAR